LEREREPSENRDKAANWGTLCHWWKETGRVNMPGASKSDIRCLTRKIEKSGIKRNDYWPAGKGEHEVTFAYNLRTLEVRWYRGPRKKADLWKEKLRANPEWMTGTVDWVGNDGSIDDLKTGNIPPLKADGTYAWPPLLAQGNHQLLSYAIPWWLEAGRPIRYKRKLSITQWPRYPQDGLPVVRRGTAQGIELAAHLADLQWTLEHPNEANPDRETCRFCECKNNCAAFLTSGITYEKRAYGKGKRV
jgi:hypothetical protein